MSSEDTGANMGVEGPARDGISGWLLAVERDEDGNTWRARPVDDDLSDHDQATKNALFSRPMPDWTDRAAVASFAASGAELVGNDPEQAHATAARIWDRTPSSKPSVQQPNQLGTVFGRLDCAPRWRERLGDLRLPTFVVHGRADPFFRRDARPLTPAAFSG